MRLPAFAVILALLAAPAWKARAQRALLDGEATPPALRAAIRASTGLSLVSREELQVALEARAAAGGRDPAQTQATEALARARRAYVELRLGEARAAYREALAALLGSDRTPADPRRVARALFERSLLHLAAHRPRDARSDLRAAVAIFPAFEPDPEVYGAPVLELFARVRRARASARQIAFVDLPEGAVVRVNGALEDAVAEVRGEGPHLVTVEHLGSAPRSALVRARGPRTEIALPLEPAAPALVAAQLLALGDAAPAERMLRVEQIDRVVRVRPLDDGFDVSLRSATGEVLARAVGARLEGEPRPYFALAERLAGRDYAPPPPPAPASLAVSAPPRVAPEAAIVFRVTLRDPDETARRLRAACGAVRADTSARPEARLALRAPRRVGGLPCTVAALDVAGGVLVSRRLSIDVVEPPADETLFWALGGGAAAAVVTAVAILAVVLYQPSQVLVIEGLDP